MLEGRARVFVFESAGLRCALFADDVQEICRAVAITPLAGAAPSIEGIIGYRGTFVPVVDVRARLGLEPRKLRSSDHLIVARAKERVIALRVDAALELAEVENVVPIDAIVRGTPKVAGVATIDGGLVLVHDLSAFMSEAELP